MTSFFPWSCVWETSASDISNACLLPTRKASIFAAEGGAESKHVCVHIPNKIDVSREDHVHMCIPKEEKAREYQTKKEV